MVNINISNVVNIDQAVGVHTGTNPRMPASTPAEVKAPQVESVDLTTQVGFNWEGVPEAKKQDRETITKAVKDMNAAMQASGQYMRFGVYGDTDQFYVQVIDMNSRKVVKMMPPEALLELRQRLQESVGLIVDEEG